MFLISSLMLITEINFLFWIGIYFPIDMHSFLVAISKGWCSNITVCVKKIISQGMLREGLIFPSYLTVTESIMEVFFPIQQPVSYTENNLVQWPWTV